MNFWANASPLEIALPVDQRAWATALRLTMTDHAGVELDQDAAGYHPALRPAAERPYDPVNDFWVGQWGDRGVFVHRGPSERTTGLHQALRRLDDLDLMIVMRAAELIDFHTNQAFCGRCGAATVVADWGRSRHCPGCAAEHFPRIDPAIIVALIDQRDRLLLGHRVDWEPGQYSLFAGFVEAGESPEQTVAREVLEEVGLVVTDVAYQGGQPWPGPRSLMLSYRARADGQPRPDGAEIELAQWFSRAELTAGVADGRIVMPPASSVAHRLIGAWLAEGS